MAWENPKTNWGQPGQTVPGVDDFNRIEGNIDILGKYDRAPGYGTATGENNKTISLNPAPGSYYDGLCFAFKNETQNTGAVTINVNGMGARPLKKPNGSDVATGYLKAGSIYTVRYNATTGNFILQGSDSTGDAMPEHVLAGKTFSNDDGPDQVGTMPNRAGDNIALSSSVSGNTLKLKAPQGYYDGVDDTVTITDDGWVEGNIKKGINIFGKMGTLVDLSATRLTIQSGTAPYSSGSTQYRDITVYNLKGNTPKIILGYAHKDDSIKTGLGSISWINGSIGNIAYIEYSESWCSAVIIVDSGYVKIREYTHTGISGPPYYYLAIKYSISIYI